MKTQYPFLRIFKNSKPIIGMIHLKGYTNREVYERAIREINTMAEAGVDAVMIENYFGDEFQVEDILKYLSGNPDKIVYGHNILGKNALSFKFAREYGSQFIQFDSVSGHLIPEQDKRFHENFMREKENCNAFILGGVRFKYQPQHSGRTLAEDLDIGMKRSEAICVTGSGTGIETDLEKINLFRKSIGNFPLLVCAGMTAKNCVPQLKIADGAVVGSYFKNTFKDTGDVCQQHVVEFMNVVSDLRRSLLQKDFN